MDKSRVTLDTFNLDEYYVVTGITTEKAHGKAGERVYTGTDSHSGGYPYWTKWPSSADRYKDIEQAIARYRECTNEGYMSNQATNIRIGVVRTTVDLASVTTEHIDEKRKEAALNKLTADEKRLLGL